MGLYLGINNSSGIEGDNSLDGSASNGLDPDHPGLNGGYPRPWFRNNGSSDQGDEGGKKVAPMGNMTYDPEKDGSFNDWLLRNQDRIQRPSGSPPDRK